jgi:phage repressor protein C with HTH and peptisase S24 domain
VNDPVGPRIIDFLSQQDGPLNLADIARGAQVSRPSVRKVLAELDDDGRLDVDRSMPGSPRYRMRPAPGDPGYQPLDENAVMAAFGLPDAGSRVPVTYPRDLFPEEHLAIWRVSGDSMSGDNINDGDLVLLDQTRLPGDNDITAVLLGAGNQVLKRVRYREDGTRELVSSNPAHPPIVLSPETGSMCWGVLVGVITTLPDGRRTAWRVGGPAREPGE